MRIRVKGKKQVLMVKHFECKKHIDLLRTLQREVPKLNLECFRDEDGYPVRIPIAELNLDTEELWFLNPSG